MPAKVSLISPALDPGSTTVEVGCALRTTGKYKAGTPVEPSSREERFECGQSTAFRSAYCNDGIKSVMVVGADGSAHKIAVQLGISDGDEFK